jgi:hypothetical protein
VRGQSRRARRRLGVGIADAPWDGEARQADGFILQAVLPDESRRWFLRQGQPLKEALREVCAVLDGIGGKVETISSPTTILRDLQGSRVELTAVARRTGGQMTTPEKRYLGQVGRLDLLAS